MDREASLLLTQGLLESFHTPLQVVEGRLLELQAHQHLLLTQIAAQQESLKTLPNAAEFLELMQQMPEYQAKVLRTRSNMTKLTKHVQQLSARTEALRVKREQRELGRAAERERKLEKQRELIASEPPS